MRDINRIDKVMEKFKELWKMVPDFRFWQVINILDFSDYAVEGKPFDPFYLEENDWLKILNKTIKKLKKNKTKKK